MGEEEYYIYNVNSCAIVGERAGKKFNKKILDFSPLMKSILPYLYMFTYAIVAGFIIFYGIEYIDAFLTEFTDINNNSIINLIAVSFVASFCYYYVGSTKDILQTIGGSKIQFNTAKNVTGFILGRSIVIAVLIIITRKNSIF